MEVPICFSKIVDSVVVRAASVVFMAFSLASVGFAATAPGGGRPESITVVLDDNYPPYIFRDSAGTVQGILKDTWALWEARTGIKVNLRAMDWARAQQAMAAGRANVIDTMFVTAPRKKLYDFSTPYASIEVPIFFHKSIGGIVDADSLRGFRVGVKEGDACIDVLRAHMVTSFQTYPSYELLINAAVAQEIRVFCVDRPPASYFLYKLGAEKEFRFSAPLYVGEFHWAVRKGDDALKRIVEDGFARISDAERRRIEAKWLGSALDRKIQPYARNAGYALLAMVGLACVLAAWNLTLRRRVAVRTAELRDAKQLAENALNSLTATIDAIPDLLFETDLEGRYITCRAIDSSLLLAPAEQMLGRTVSEVLPAEAAEVVMEALREAAEKGTSHGSPRTVG